MRRSVQSTSTSSSRGKCTLKNAMGEPLRISIILMMEQPAHGLGRVVRVGALGCPLMTARSLLLCRQRVIARRAQSRAGDETPDSKAEPARRIATGKSGHRSCRRSAQSMVRRLSCRALGLDVVPPDTIGHVEEFRIKQPAARADVCPNYERNAR